MKNRSGWCVVLVVAGSLCIGAGVGLHWNPPDPAEGVESANIYARDMGGPWGLVGGKTLLYEVDVQGESGAIVEIRYTSGTLADPLSTYTVENVPVGVVREYGVSFVDGVALESAISTVTAVVEDVTPPEKPGAVSVIVPAMVDSQGVTHSMRIVLERVSE